MTHLIIHQSREWYRDEERQEDWEVRRFDTFVPGMTPGLDADYTQPEAESESVDAGDE